MSVLLAVCCCVLGQSEVTVRPLRGQPLRGVLVELTEKNVTISTGDVKRSFEASTLLSISAAPSRTGANAAGQSASGKNPASKDSAEGAWLELTDGSSFSGQSYRSDQNGSALRSHFGEDLKIPPKLVRSVRFYAQSDSVRKQWATVAERDPLGDVLVVRRSPAKSENSGPSDVVLDRLTGIVHEIRDTAVVFEFDSDKIVVPRARVEGVVYRQQPADSGDPICRVKDLDGGIWNAKSIKLANQRLSIVSVAGAEVELPIDQIHEIDFSAANLVFLNDLEPESMEWRPYLESSATPASLRKWFEPKGAPVTLNGESFDKALALHSRTQLTYRLTGNFRRFIAHAGIDERFRSTADLQLVVTGDGRTLLSRRVKGDDEPFAIELDIDGVRRLGILVDFGDDRSDAGDLLDLCNARLEK